MKKVILIFLVFIVLFILISNRLRKKKETEKLPVEKYIPVEVANVKEILIEDEIETVGQIEPFKKVVVYSEVTGKVEKLNVDEGDYVKKGDFIAQIDYKKRKLEYENILSQLEAAKANLQNIKKDYDRFFKLYKEGVIAEKRLDDIKTAYRVSLNQTEALEKQLALTKVRLEEAKIYSPIEGVVAERFIDPGEIITESSMMKNSPIVGIINIDKVKVKIGISEENIKNVKVGQEVVITTDAYPDKRFHGRVGKIFPYADNNTKTVDAEVIIANPSHLLKPGMYCKTKIITGKRRGLVIPLDAVMRLPASGNYYCFKVEEEKAKRVYIKPGKIGKDYVEVKEGLNKGDLVITTSQGILETGKRIKIVKGENI